MNESIREQLKRLNRETARVNLPRGERQRIYGQVSEAIAAVRHREQTGAFEQFVAGYVGREATKYRQSGDDRTDRLCYCSDPQCPLKRGKLPPQLRTEHYEHFSTPGAREQVTRYLQEHSGAVVLLEALREWDRQAAAVERELRQAVALVQSHRPDRYEEQEEWKEAEA